MQVAVTNNYQIPLNHHYCNNNNSNNNNNIDNSRLSSSIELVNDLEKVDENGVLPDFDLKFCPPHRSNNFNESIHIKDLEDFKQQQDDKLTTIFDDTLTLALSFGKVDRSRSSVFRWDDRNLQNTKIVKKKSERAIICIQAFIRMVLCRLGYRRRSIKALIRRMIQVRNDKATIIQALVRRYLATVRKERLQLNHLQTTSAIMIQSHIRGYLGKIQKDVLLMEKRIQKINKDKDIELRRIQKHIQDEKEKFTYDITATDRAVSRSKECIVWLKQEKKKMKQEMSELKDSINTLKKTFCTVKECNMKLGKERGKLELQMEKPLQEHKKLQQQLVNCKSTVQAYEQSLKEAKLQHLMASKQTKAVKSVIKDIIGEMKNRCGRQDVVLLMLVQQKMNNNNIILVQN